MSNVTPDKTIHIALGVVDAKHPAATSLKVRGGPAGGPLTDRGTFPVTETAIPLASLNPPLDFGNDEIEVVAVVEGGETASIPFTFTLTDYPPSAPTVTDVS